MKKKIATKIINVKVYNWNKRTKYEQDKAIFHLIGLIDELVNTYRKTGIADEFTAMY